MGLVRGISARMVNIDDTLGQLLAVKLFPVPEVWILPKRVVVNGKIHFWGKEWVHTGILVMSNEMYDDKNLLVGLELYDGNKFLATAVDGREGCDIYKTDEYHIQILFRGNEWTRKEDCCELGTIYVADDEFVVEVLTYSRYECYSHLVLPHVDIVG